MEIFVVLLGAVAGIAVLASIIGGFFIWIGAKLAGIEKATFLKSILAAIASSLAVWILTAGCSVLPVIGTFLGFIFGMIASIWIIKAIFDTTAGKAFLAWILHFVAQIIALIIGLLTFAGGLLGILGIIQS